MSNESFNRKPAGSALRGATCAFRTARPCEFFDVFASEVDDVESEWVGSLWSVAFLEEELLKELGFAEFVVTSEVSEFWLEPGFIDA